MLRDQAPLVWRVESELEGFNDLPELNYRNYHVRKHIDAELDLGAGMAALSENLSLKPGVKAALAVELCEQVANKITSAVGIWILGEEAERMVHAVGSFN